MSKEKKAKKKDSQESEVIVSQSLAVRERPRKFKDLVGQDHVVTTIKGMFKSNKFPGSILLEGQTGGGKTTTARMIFAYLNCAKRTACGECPSCLAGVESHPDLTVINAGTDGGVDNMRKLIKQSKLAPMFRKRVVIIDEAHKLTGASAEAILIPLEEPSRDTIFILCTTEPEGLKPTVKNRCTRLVMRPIPKEAVVKRLAEIAKREGVDILKAKGGEKALEMIADFTNGSMREAISVLENVLFGVAGGGDITDKHVLNAYVQNSEVDLDKAAAVLVATLQAGKFKTAIATIRKTTNMRGLLAKTLWLLDYLVGKQTGTAKFTPYTGKLYHEIEKKEKIDTSFSNTMRLLRLFVEANQDFNRTTVNESLILHAAIERYASEVAE